MPTSGKKVLFVLTSHDHKGERLSGFWLAEATHAHRALTQAGYEVEFASPKGGPAPVDPESFDLRDPINAAFYENEKLRRAVENTKQPAELVADDYVGVFFAGGHGALWDLPDDAALAALTARVYDRGGVVGALGHGPAGLVNVRRSDGRFLVEGLDVASFTDEEERAAHLDQVVPFMLADRLAEHGAHLKAAPPFQPKVVVSERLVTGQNAASATGVALAMAKLLAQPGAAPPAF